MTAHAVRARQVPRGPAGPPALVAVPSAAAASIFDIPIDLAAPADLLHDRHGLGGARQTRRVMYVNAHVVNQSHTTPGPARRPAAGRSRLLRRLRRAPGRAGAAPRCPAPDDRRGLDLGPGRSVRALGAVDLPARLRATGRPEAAARLPSWYPELDVVGAHHGFFELGSPHNERVIEDIVERAPRIVLVGMGTPKQELWADRYADQLGGAVVWTVGALFDYVSGHTPRAPRWLADNGLEWIFRLAIEPQRMWRRYLIGNPVFLSRVLNEKRHTWDRRPLGLDQRRRRRLRDVVQAGRASRSCAARYSALLAHRRVNGERPGAASAAPSPARSAG